MKQLFIHSILQLFTECLLCARYLGYNHGGRGGTKILPCLSGAYFLGEENNEQQT